jgi:hypothetical protein
MQLVIAVGPFAQVRDAARQEEEDGHADHNLRNMTIKRRKKRVCIVAPKWIL